MRMTKSYGYVIIRQMKLFKQQINNIICTISCLILLMGKDSNTCYKNAICASVGLLIVFTTSIFVAKDYFGLRIATLIDQAALLKDYKYADWGQHPGKIDAEYTYAVNLYDQKAKGVGDKLDAIFDHSFNYRNISFGQGNQGFIKFLHEWDLTIGGQLSCTPASTLNLAAQKIYNYEHLAPPARRFAILYNTLWRTVEQQLLPFFATQLHTFYFKNRKTVESVVFSEIGLPADKIEAIYSDETFGWGKVETFKPWVKLAHQQNRSNILQYELIQETLGISRDQLERLVGNHSMLNTLSIALNGTIKAILQNSRTYNYAKCDPFCNNDQLVAFQLMNGGLTSNPVFVNVNMQSSLRDLNNTIPNDVELNKVCPTCILDQNAIGFFTAKYLGNFSIMAKAFANLSDTDTIQDLFDIQNPTFAQNIVDYMNYLQDNIFNPTNPTTQEVDNEAYGYMVNNHLYINLAINALKDVLNIELHTRAMAQVIQDKQLQCEDFFDGSYKAFVGLCQKQGFDLININAVRTYIKAYFFQGRAEFINATGMTATQASQFLRIDQNSKFAASVKQIRATFSTAFGCSKAFCSEEELLAMEWSGEQDVLSRLPADYFLNSSASISDWDVQFRLSGLQPQFHKLVGQKISTEQGKLLLGSGKQSILVLFNLLYLKTQTDAGDENAKKLVSYVQKVALDVYFGGAKTNQAINQILLGFQTSGLAQKRLADELVGGASWLPEQVQLIQTKHRPSAYSKINTGIYNRDRLRSMSQVEQNNVFGSHFTLFKSEYEEVTRFLTSGNKVTGTNLLGFHSDISSSDSLEVSLNFAYQSSKLSNSPTQTNLNGVDALRYSLKSNPKDFIGLNEQNERYISITPDSYFIIDPITGNTLQFRVKYTVSSPASFLKYYPNASTAERPIFDCEVYYSRKDISAIAEIADAKSTLRGVYILTIVLASLSMISIVVFALILRVKNRGKESELNDTLISSEGSSLISPEGKPSIKG